MNDPDIISLGLMVLLFASIILTGFIGYKLGYTYGRQDGFQQGLHRGKNFQRWKHFETDRNQGRN